MLHFGAITSSRLREPGCVGDIAFKMEFITGLHQTQEYCPGLGAVIVFAL